MKYIICQCWTKKRKLYWKINYTEKARAEELEKRRSRFVDKYKQDNGMSDKNGSNCGQDAVIND